MVNDFHSAKVPLSVPDHSHILNDIVEARGRDEEVDATASSSTAETASSNIPETVKGAQLICNHLFVDVPCNIVFRSDLIRSDGRIRMLLPSNLSKA